MDWHLLLEYIKVLIYPVIIVATLFYYRKNFTSFIDRLWKLKFPGGELEAEKQIEAQELEKTEPMSIKELEDLFDDGDLVQNVKENYEKILEDTKKSNEETINNLLNEIAIRDLVIDFEKIYKVIFGSQISLLQHLNTKGFSGDTRVYLESFFQTVKNIWPILKDWNLDQYLGYLITKSLIDTSQGTYKITDRGKSFLSYVFNSGYTDQKSL